MDNTTIATVHNSNAITAFAQNCAKEYSIHRLNRLNTARELRLIRLAQSGDARATNLVFLHNYETIMVLTYLWNGNKHINQHEILSACTDGLLSAINTYNTNKCSFKTFAIKRMRNQIRHITAYLGGAISLNDTAYFRIMRVNKMLESGMTISEIATILGITIKQAKTYALATFKAVNDGVINDDTQYTEVNNMYDHLEYLVENELDEFSRFVLKKRFGLRCKKMTESEIAKICKCDRLKIHRIIHKALDKFKTLV